MRILNQKRPPMADRECWLYRDYVPVHTVAIVTSWMGARQIQVNQHPAYLPDNGTCKLVSLPQGEEEAGWPYPHPEDLQEGVRGTLRIIAAA
jgi:hypothetical protein